MGRKKRNKSRGLKSNNFRVALFLILFLFIALHVVDKIVYPTTVIIHPDIFLAMVVLQLFLLWFDSVKEKYHILWIQKRKEELSEMKSKFSLIASHELRTPLTVIKEYIAIMQDKIFGELTEKQSQALDTITKYFSRLEGIQNNLTKLCSGVSPSFEKNLKLFSLEEIVKTTADDVMPFIKKRNQGLSVDIKESIPAVMMDVNGIRQVLVNLLLNSIRFTPDKGKIIIRASQDDNYVKVEVEDNGIGIPDEKIDRIFESFYEAQDTAGHSSGHIEFKSGGMGLGLTIAKRIIDSHNGKIWAQSKPNEFSVFTFAIQKNNKACS